MNLPDTHKRPGISMLGRLFFLLRLKWGYYWDKRFNRAMDGAIFVASVDRPIEIGYYLKVTHEV